MLPAHEKNALYSAHPPKQGFEYCDKKYRMRRWNDGEQVWAIQPISFAWKGTVRLNACEKGEKGEKGK